MNRLLGALVAAVLAATLMVAANPAGAAPPTAVDFTIEETLDPLSTGSLVAGSIPLGCDTPTVTTTGVRVGGGGDLRTFAAVKDFDCGGGDAFTISLNARVRDCSTSDTGTWRVTGGTGVFAGLRGSGRLVGTYFGGTGDSCGPDGIFDNYTGRFILP